MSEDFTPETEPAGSLVPPIKHPPTAVEATDVPLPPRPALTRIRQGEGGIGAFVERMLDTLDAVGDSIARVARLRRAPAPPKV
jgi:hypothetical protein